MKKYLLFSFIVLLFFCLAFVWLQSNHVEVAAEDIVLNEQEATIRAINRVLPSVVSIEVFDYDNNLELDLENGEQRIVRNRKSKGRGTGFIISDDGYILTNKHVLAIANETSGEYQITLNSGKQYYAQFIGVDPMKDLAILKIFDKDLPYVELSDSRDLVMGTTVIAIGNSLGRYQNSATKGIVSGLGRFLVATDNDTGVCASLDNVIQTDAEINLGNSGGPLINLRGEVVGVNVAIDESGSAIGFTIPINDAKPIIRSIRENGTISRPRLGVYYMMLDPVISEKYQLPRTSGAWIAHAEEDEGDVVLPDSAAGKAGILAGDIIFEINAIPIDGKDTLAEVAQRYLAGDKIGLKIQRGEKILILELTLDEF
ncbi:MAG: trypsin-like peptidase domain-containing protein [Patescibacteria group bacterium]|nr:trypsin-like peptidase domain-containing protein [Patescibacteria group bacterium]